MPICRSTVQDVSGIHNHHSRLMQYHAANDVIKELGEDAGYRHPHSFILLSTLGSE